MQNEGGSKMMLTSQFGLLNCYICELQNLWIDISGSCKICELIYLWTAISVNCFLMNLWIARVSVYKWWL
jgi:hypothetical protein